MSLESEHYVIAYGSLLSHDSRSRFSGINCQAIPVHLSGWRRAWTTRTLHEQQTCLSAKVEEDASFNAVLVPIEQISPELAKREQDYEFVQVHSSQLSILEHELENEQNKITHNQLTSKSVWICQNKLNESANSHYPICQTYVDTCLAGCLETGLIDFAVQFLQSTIGWDAGWINDRHAPRYPRAATTSAHSQTLIDQILAQAGLLQFRTEN
jgi:cation transport regulator ChaC